MWLACSGGRDSLGLAHVCLRLYQAGQLPCLPQLLHVNHNVQPGSQAWSRHTVAWASKHNLSCEVLTLYPACHDEQSLRQARYAAMYQHMNNGDVLMLGHHADDQIETMLMRLFNGAGVGGLAGIQPWSTQIRHDDRFYLWRPWLDKLAVNRLQITDYVKRYRLPFIDDPSNGADTIIGDRVQLSSLADDVRSDGVSHALSSAMPNAVPNGEYNNDRAWLRSVLLPVIEQRFSTAKSGILRANKLLADAKTRLTEQVHMDLSEVADYPASLCNIPTWHEQISIARFKVLSDPRQSAVVHYWLTRFDPQSGERHPPSLQTVQQILALTKRHDNDHQTIITHGVWAVCRYQDTLYCMHSTWLTWLSMAWPSATLTDRSTAPSISHTDDRPLAHLQLTKAQTSFAYHLIMHNQQVLALFKNMTKDTANKLMCAAVTKDAVALYNRQGRKSGKKLAQALGVPAFMRASMQLLVLTTATQTLPLLVVTPLGCHAVAGPYAFDLHQFIIRGHLTLSVVHCVAKSS